MQGPTDWTVIGDVQCDLLRDRAWLERGPAPRLASGLT